MGRVLMARRHLREIKRQIEKRGKHKKLDKVNLNRYHNDTIGIVRFCKVGEMTAGRDFITVRGCFVS